MSTRRGRWFCRCGAATAQRVEPPRECWRRRALIRALACPLARARRSEMLLGRRDASTPRRTRGPSTWCRGRRWCLSTGTPAAQRIIAPRHLRGGAAEAGALALAHACTWQDVDLLRRGQVRAPCGRCAAVVGLCGGRCTTAPATHRVVAPEGWRDRGARRRARAASSAAASIGVISHARRDVGAPCRRRGWQMALRGRRLRHATAATADGVVSPRDRRRR